jgi:hypothetical protein
LPSIYQHVLGSEFDRLHPQIQKRFGFSSEDNVAAIGTGIMEKIWHGAPYTLPFLYLGAWRSIMFPEQGENIPFQIENYAYQDELGRETVTWVRTFQTLRPRRFDAYMIHSEQRRCVVDYLGTHQHLAVDIALSVTDRGGLSLRSGDQRFYEGILGFNFPMLFTGIAEVCEWYDDSSQKFRIEVVVTNRTWGRLFGYRGAFDVQWVSGNEASVPPNLLPKRLEARE